ncbi:TD and POZ domain-containing protein 4-like [Trichogramma pretiosum]|uniref:TD and POZ domain-containing protein 4-like n=1 Tax=Trichogramma pretiosum TaxID=7493 RepID=UPI0006C93DAF|nr:TD and POZ domain-containing protein 4-like [Trichogramma pretiosum]XP_023319025.1 TD and POZ domain-containing protein 4-like [Trichogramma pretiosum]
MDQVIVTTLSASYMEWHIKKELIEKTDVITSPIFLCSRKKPWRFVLKWVLIWDNNDYITCLKIFLQRSNEDDVEDEVNSKKSYLQYKNCQNCVTYRKSLSLNEITISDIQKSNLNKYLKNGIMEIRFWLVTKLKNDEYCTLLSVLPSSTLYNNSDFSDVQLSVGNQSFHAHKAILANCSQVFATMFNIDMKESKDNIVKINDLNAETVQSMLQFVYTRKVEQLNENIVINLLMASDKYQMEDLKIFCENYLYRSINCNNCIRIIELADLYKMDLLKFWAKSVIAQNIKTISTSEDFIELGKKNYDLLMEIVSYSFDCHCK